MNIRKHWKKVVLSCAALFWASCGDDSISNTKIETRPHSTDSSSGTIQEQSSSSSAFNYPVPAYGVYVPPENYRYVRATDTTISCAMEMAGGKTTFYCTNGSVYNNSDVVVKKGRYIYTPEEAEEMIGPCVEHGGRAKTDSINKNLEFAEWYYIDEELQSVKDSLKYVYYENFRKIFDKNGENRESKGIRECLSEFYQVIQPVCLYGGFPVPQSSESTAAKGNYVEKVTCNDGTIVNEDAYNRAAQKVAEAKAVHDQNFADGEYCLNKKIYDLIDSCNTVNKSEIPVSIEPPDTTKVSDALLHTGEFSCDDFDTDFNH